MTDLQEKTKHLMQKLEELRVRYETSNPPDDISDRSFFQHVKEETNPIYKDLEIWEESVLDLVKQREIQLHPQQVTSTRENMELLLMHSFYIDIKRKRYMAFYKSVHFIFDQLLKDFAS